MSDHTATPCESCGTLKFGKRLCKACYIGTLMTAADARRVCIDCGGLRYSVKSSRCMACSRKAARAAAKHNGLECPDCGGRKESESRRCWQCRVGKYQEGLPTPAPMGVIMVGFRPDVFARAIDRAGWTPELLAEWTTRNGEGVSAHAIRQWISGRKRPNQMTLAAVQRVLEMERCRHCDGLGMMESEPGRLRLVAKQPSPRDSAAYMRAYRARKRAEQEAAS